MRRRFDIVDITTLALIVACLACALGITIGAALS